MAIRERKGRASPWQCYWNNPITGKRECANFATRLEAEKNSLENNLDYMNTDAFIEEQAREHFGMIKDGETLYIYE